MKLLAALATVVLSLAPVAHAQVPSDPVARQAYFDDLYARVLDLQKRHTITVRGSENPAALDRGAVLRTFFQTMPSTDTGFPQFAASRFGATGVDLAVLRNAGAPPQQAVDVCESVLDGSLADGLTIAKRVNAINDATNRAAEAHYQAVINKLTPTVRNKVTQRINEQAAYIESVNLDYLAMALEDPELFKMMMLGQCGGAKTARSLRPPAEPKVVHDQGLISTTQR